MTTDFIEEIEFAGREIPLSHSELRGLLHAVFGEIRELRTEVRIMADTQAQQDAEITADVTALTTAFTNYTTAVAAEIAAIQASPAAADPIVAQGLTNIEALTATINAATTAATPAAPATPSTDAPVTA